MIFRAFLLSLQCLSDRAILLILVKTLVITLMIFAVSGAALWFALRSALSGWTVNNDIFAIVSTAAAMVFLGWLLWRVIAIAVLWFFADDIVEAVEARHYPVLARSGRRPPLLQSAQMALISIGRAIGYNLLALPVYILLLITGVGTGLVFMLVNGLLLGRDLQAMLTARHGTDKIRFSRSSRLILGMIGTAAMLIPVANLLVPIVATAMAVHMAHFNRTGSLLPARPLHKD